jgi:cytochrome c oxidase subunit III
MTDYNEKSPKAEAVDGKVDVFEGLDPDIKIRTKKMMMWFIIFAVVMLFAGITSAIIVLYGKLIWLRMNPTTSLWISNILIILSSFTLIAANAALKKGNQSMATGLTVATLVLGLAFAFSQNTAWKELASKGMGNTQTRVENGMKATHWNALGKLSGNYGTDYFFEMNGTRIIKEDQEYYLEGDATRKPVTNAVMTTFNAVGAMLFVLIYVHIIHLIIGLIYLSINIVRLYKGRINSNNWISLHVNGMYWHLLGVLWLYLFFFIFYIF